MVRNKLENLINDEAKHYLKLPYMSNVLKEGKIIKEKFLGGKGNWQDIQKETLRIVKNNNLNHEELSSQQIYNLQKKNKIGIDCSGLVTQLLIFYAKLLNKEINLNPRRTSANMLTSSPLSKKITSLDDIKIADLVRQKDGHHVLFILKKKDNIISYIDSSRENRRVKYGQFNLEKDKKIYKKGIYRLIQLT